jgi:serine/threonine-protein kinase
VSRPETPEGDTARIPAAGRTSPLPSPLTPTSQAVVHASGVTPSGGAASRRSPSSRVRTLVALLVVLLLAGGAGGWWWWTQYGPGSYVELPATAGRSAAAVESDLKALGLDYALTQAFSDDVEEGTVISSEPDGGMPVHKDSEVRLTVSKGVDMRTVPDLVGRGEDEARTALTDAGLTAGALDRDWSETVPEGQVVSQATKAGTSVPHGTKVDLVVSKGREPLAVPDLTGLGGDEARAKIEALGLTASPSEAYSDTVDAGVVISQSTGAGTTLHRGDPVSYVVSKGPEMVTVPDLTGKQLEEAQQDLEALGLSTDVRRLAGGWFNTVRSTDPAAGTAVPKGTTVTITIV